MVITYDEFLSYLFKIVLENPTKTVGANVKCDDCPIARFLRKKWGGNFIVTFTTYKGPGRTIAFAEQWIGEDYLRTTQLPFWTGDFMNALSAWRPPDTDQPMSRIYIAAVVAAKLLIDVAHEYRDLGLSLE